MIENNKIYVVNQAYKFKNDIKRVVLTNNYDSLLKESIEYTENFSWKMHPYIAYIFSFFDGKRTLQEIKEFFVQEADISEDFFF